MLTSPYVAIYYVDGQQVNPVNNGSQAYPFSTIGEALDHARPGDTIRVSDGEYHEDVVITQPGITLEARIGERPVIVGTLNIRQAEHVSVRDLTIDGRRHPDNAQPSCCSVPHVTTYLQRYRIDNVDGSDEGAALRELLRR